MLLKGDLAAASAVPSAPHRRLHHRLLQPKIEAEVAFVLAADLDHPTITEDDVAATTAHVVAALEIVDSRIAD